MYIYTETVSVGDSLYLYCRQIEIETETVL